MNSRFHEYRALTAQEISELWANAFFVPDANVLLSLYRFTDQTRDTLLATFSHANFNTRIWIPDQVALEFHRNRQQVLIEQTHIAESLSREIEKQFADLQKYVSQEFPRYHPFLDRESWASELKKAESELREPIRAAVQARTSLFADDPVLDRVLGLFAGKVGPEPTEQEVKEMVEEADRRFREKRPPGFKDADKSSENQRGDYFLWAQIVAESKRTGRPAVFITDDAKEDWWLRIAGRTIGPHPLLRREFVAKTGQKVHFYSSEQFLVYASELTGTKASAAVTNELILNAPRGRHQFRDFHEPPEDFDLDDQAEDEEADSEAEDSLVVKKMVEWFYRRYEDPANGVPHDTGEGGYQYVNGGPYDPLEELSDQFPEATQEHLEEAAGRIYPDGHEWVKVGQY